MTRNVLRLFTWRRACALLLAGFATAACLAASVSYEYDAAGRLRRVTNVDGKVTDYTLDAAGNRTNVATAVPAGSPASITVPASSANGAYTVSWTAPASGGTVTAYQIFEATNASFTGESQVYAGLNLSLPVTGKASGTYYYRVRACASTLCGGYATGSNPVVVAIPPSVPSSITVPATSSTGTYTVSWGASTGTVTAYELWEATNSGFTGETRVYNSTGTSTSLTRGGGTYYYQVRACNGASCSAFTAGTPNIVVSVPPVAPSTITVPATNNTGAFTVTWSAVSGTVTAYELWEATNSSFTGETRVYNSTGTSFGVTGKANGTYYYRARACNTAGCGGYATSTGTVVALPPGAPISITSPATSTTSTYTVSWGAASGTLTAYELYEANNSGFTGATLAYSGTGLSTSITGKSDGSYWYRVRACNGGSNCSGYTAVTAPTVVTIPPGVPGTLTIPASSVNGVYTVSWVASTGTITQYQLEQYRNDPSFTTVPVVYTPAGTSQSITVTADGLYYYRVRACNGSSACSGYRNGGNAASVALTPAAPATITNPATSTSSSYTVSWAAVSGTVTAYELYEANNSGFTGATLAYSGTGTSAPITGKTDGSYWYRVRACNGSGNCSGYTTVSSPTVVTLPPGAPGTLTIPASSVNGVYTVSWIAAAGSVSQYQLEQYRNDPGFTTIPVVYTPAGTSQGVTVSSDGLYYYRVRACNASGCSGYTNGGNAASVALTPGAPSSINVPASSTNGSYTVSWGAPATGNVTGYELYEANNSGFSGATLVYSSNGTSTGIAGKTDGSYWYRVRACNGAGNCGGYTSGGPAAVTLPPGTPGTVSLPGSSTNGVFSVSWLAASGSVTQYQLEQFTNPSFSGTPVVWTTGNLGTTVTVSADGTYYFRVRACNASGCGGYSNGSGGVSVVLPPGAPTSISVPSSSNNGTIAISWGAAAFGTPTTYQLSEATNSSFSGETIVYNNLAFSTTLAARANNTSYWYRVRACNQSGCGPWTSGGPTVVQFPSSSITISDRTVFHDGAGLTAEYFLRSTGDINISTDGTGPRTDVGDWLTPKSNMNLYEAQAVDLGSSGCSGPMNRWVDLGTEVNGSSAQWRAGTTGPSQDFFCNFNLQIRAKANPSVILGVAHIVVEVASGE